MIDQLIVTNLKIFKFEDLKRQENASDADLANWTRATNTLNSARNLYITEIDKKINSMIEKGELQEIQSINSVKSYGK